MESVASCQTVASWKRTSVHIVRLTSQLWSAFRSGLAPVHDSMKDVMGDEIFERLYGEDWRRTQQQDVEKVLRDGKPM